MVLSSTRYQSIRGRIQRKTWCRDPMPEFTITSPYVHSRVDSNTFTMGNPMPESTLTLCLRRLYPPVRDFRFGLWPLLTMGSSVQYLLGMGGGGLGTESTLSQKYPSWFSRSGSAGTFPRWELPIIFKRNNPLLSFSHLQHLQHTYSF